MIISAQKIMLITDNAVEHKLNSACGCARYAYNWARETWFSKKKAGQKSVSTAELRKEFNALKTDWMYESPKGSMDQAIKNFGLAKKRHYDNPKQFGFPKRKKFTAKRSFYIENDKAKLIDEWTIKLPLIKSPLRLSEPVNNKCMTGKINNFVISKGSNEKWYVAISYTYDETNIQNEIDGNGIVGIDMGIKTLMQLSTGESVINMKVLNKNKLALKRYQRKMSRRRIGSSKYKRVKKQFKKKNSYVANLRTDFIQKATTEIIRKNIFIAIEDLNVKGMMKNHNLASAIADCGLGLIRRVLEYKALKYGTLLVKVDRWFPSSKKCSGCGTVKEYLSLSEREYVCEKCGLVLDRDTNAAINILAEALFFELNLRFNTDAARRKFTPVEIVALAYRLTSMSETTVVDAHCTRISKECRSALVDNFFCCLWKNVELSTVEALICIE